VTSYPAHLASSYSPIYGQAITIRPILPDDADIELEFGKNLSQESRYNRFLSGGFTLTPEWLEKLTRIDFARDMALIATVTLEGKEIEIGVARYVRLPDDTSCEFAIVVADAWHGCGVGKRLLARLIDSARSSGIRRMLGDVFATNVSMLALARALGFRSEPHAEGAALRQVVLDLEENPAP
jgi:acetyltransferase